MPDLPKDGERFKNELNILPKEPEEGPLRITVGTQNKQVILAFGMSVSWIGFSAAQARKVALSLLTAAQQIDDLQ